MLPGDEIDYEKAVLGGEEDFLAALAAIRQKILQLPKFKDPVEWIYENIRLLTNETSRAGYMRLNGYQRPVAADAMSGDVDQITILKGVQVGYSTFMKSMIIYALAYLAINVIVAQPTAKDAQGYYNDELEPVFRSSTAMTEIVRPPVRGQPLDTWREHRFKNAARLYMRGAASDDSFRRIRAKWLFGDEVDADGWQALLSDSQGDKLELFRARGTTFFDSILWIGSTPLVRDTSLVWREWCLSDQRRFFVRCPHCHTQQTLKWGDRKTPYGFKYILNERNIVTDCYYMCEGPDHCRIDEDHKEEMVENGEFIPQNLSPNREGHRGYHWPQWLSMAPKARWRSLAQQDVNARGNPDARKVFVNNVLAEPWDDLGNSDLNSATTSSQQVPYPAEVPDDIVVLTSSWDMQTNKEGSHLEQIASREYHIIGWNRKEMPSAIGYGKVLGEPSDPDARRQFDEIISRPYTKRDGTKMYIQATACDMGGHFGDQVKAECARYPKSRNVWAIKGKAYAAKGKRGPAVWPKKVSKAKKGAAVEWYMIDTQLAKDAVARKLMVKGPGGPRFPMSLPEGYFDRLMCERPFPQKKGGYHWDHPKGGRSHEEWDTFIYCYAALQGLKASYLRWRDLNLAAEKMGMKEVPHDPVTGEIFEQTYVGPDLSLMASAVTEPEVVPAATPSSGIAQRAIERRLEAQRQEPTAAPKVVGVKPMVRKRRSGGVISF
ncbi:MULTISPECIES: terminase gpA endonuclease subunit [Rhizobium]|uniref:terminase gpA endonuclease subunit n=1 Tax=Rhizobium TaxID=379 RepID=UPI00041A2ECC|nr:MULTISPECIES: terminase gpA endonuclease subunit [Rhizobium]UFS81550.1 phage terminase large subunit family protein [Rhizobium sp. T136]